MLVKGWSGTAKVLSIYSLSAVLTPLLLISFITEEITGCSNEMAKGANQAEEIHLLVFLFHVLLFQ